MRTNGVIVCVSSATESSLGTGSGQVGCGKRERTWEGAQRVQLRGGMERGSSLKQSGFLGCLCLAR